MIVQDHDLGEPAVAIYFGATGPTVDGTVRQRFPSTRDAVRFIVEHLKVEEQVNASLVFDDGDYCRVEGIVALYKRLARLEGTPRAGPS